MASAGALTASFDGMRARARFSLILSAGAMLLDRLGPPGRCRGCWPHDGEVAGGAVAEKFSEKQASIGLTALGHRKLDCNPHQLCEALALSCYFAKQAFEARQQAIRCSTSGFFEPQTGARRVRKTLGRRQRCHARLLGMS